MPTSAGAKIAATLSHAPPSPQPATRDGQHDFDFELGRWNLELRRLKQPLHGAHEWETGSGTSVTRPVWGGKANLEEREVDMPRGHVEGLTTHYP